MKQKFKQLIEKFNQLKLSQRIECIAAALLSLFLMIAIPVYAWFANSHTLETLTKIKEPPALDIRAGKAQAIKNFELRDIDITTIGNGKCYVFCVKSGSEDSTYKIQLAHTTNIPLNYNLYRAKEVNSGDPFDVDYPIDGTEQHAYYQKDGQAITMYELNSENAAGTALHGRNLAITDSSNSYYQLAYSDSNDNPEIYAVAKYSQSDLIDARTSEYDYFILELSWAGDAADDTGFKKWNKQENNKETDIIYISASKVNE